jgi:outer membrane protein assembly factor BamE
MKVVILGVVMLGVSACSVIDPLVYKINIPQGNYLEQRDVDGLRVGMTREQVEFVLGSPVLENSFRDDRWVYMYRLEPGRGDVVTRELTVNFEGDLLASISGDFEQNEQFNTPLAE